MWLKEKFDRPRAWIDLLLLANQAPGYILFRGIKIDLQRGDVGWSIETLAERWKWSRGKVNRFFELLKNERQIVSKTDIKTDIKLSSVISIVNYDLYQSKNIKTDIKRTLNGHKTDTNNNDNNENKNTELDKTAKILLDWFNKTMHKNCKTFEPFKSNLAYWLTIYTKEDIAKAIVKMPGHKFFSQMETPVVIFRRKNQNREDVDYIGQLLSSTPVKNNDLLV